MACEANIALPFQQVAFVDLDFRFYYVKIPYNTNKKYKRSFMEWFLSLKIQELVILTLGLDF